MKNQTYKVTEEEKREVDKFVEASWKNHLARGRTPDQVKNDIRIGKLGEVVFYQIAKGWYERISKPMFEVTTYGDGGKDFTVQQSRASFLDNIDVKTVDEGWKRRVYFKENGAWNRISVIQLEGDVGKYLGSLHRNDLRINRDQNGATYVNKSDFEQAPS